MFPWGQTEEGRMVTNRHKETFRNKRSVYSLDCSDSITAIYISQNITKCKISTWLTFCKLVIPQ